MSHAAQPPVNRLLPDSWRVQLPVFEGPLDLLLHLIKLNEVDITNIPVATVCDQFHEYLRLMEELDAAAAADGIDRLVLVAAPQMLGELRNVLSERVAARVEREFAKDLAGLEGPALEQRLVELVWS